MTHLPYIAASYALTLGCAAILGIHAHLRLRKARRTLAMLGQRSRGKVVDSPT